MISLSLFLQSRILLRFSKKTLKLLSYLFIPQLCRISIYKVTNVAENEENKILFREMSRSDVNVH